MIVRYYKLREKNEHKNGCGPWCGAAGSCFIREPEEKYGENLPVTAEGERKQKPETGGEINGKSKKD